MINDQFSIIIFFFSIVQVHVHPRESFVFFKQFFFLYFILSLFPLSFDIQSVLDMTGFRSLGENEVVVFKSKSSDKGVEATLVTGPNRKKLEGNKVRGDHKKPFRKTR